MMDHSFRTAFLAGAIALLLLLVISRRRGKQPLIESAKQSHVPTINRALQLREVECLPYKELFFRLHNLESFFDVSTEAKAVLLSLLSESLHSASRANCAILLLKDYSDAGLDRFVQGEMEAVMQDWRHYLARRKLGQPRELFSDAPSARRWLIEIAPSKLVDGAWLGRVHNIMTPFAFRRVTKAAWQIFSEELGDGSLERCHAQLYARLLGQIGAELPPPSSRDFISFPGMDNSGVWRSALAQLLVSIFPQEFLPEVLGFNLGFEIVTSDTLRACKELREVGIDPYYFTLHVAIDNADTGHTAMASRIVKDYLSLITDQGGESAAQDAWRRIQAGFILSKYTEQCSETTSLGTKVGEMFLAKSVASHGIHEHCQVNIGGRTLSTWLDPDRLCDRQWQQYFLEALGSSKPWVYRGDSGRSRLFQQVSWGGPMFGAFTDRETMLMRDWIESLSPMGPGRYEMFTGRKDYAEIAIVNQSDEDVIRMLSDSLQSDVVLSPSDTNMKEVTLDSTMVPATKLDYRKLLPLWFAHSCLLESAVAVPWNVTNDIGCAIMRLLRAQYGFGSDPVGIHGLDEMRRVDLVDIGLEMWAGRNFDRPLPGTFKEVLAKWPAPFAEMMLAAARRPAEYLWVLIVICQAFTKLHRIIASSPDILSEAKRKALRQIEKREEASLQSCLAHLGQESPEYQDYQRGYSLGSLEIRACLT